ncbi:LOW QUALITY PROTEIN: hypothetical protein TorRG33x02_016320 [Trema orientale]|uniref:Uncharacterized protein n=1 Tax=Trema orientale TaxID=63057 RepID=A0A2P5FXX3_TREOI|nr:LOW QUALITY PROTEIN: hypothetical protein TorRG33x02_016320 [Trema orientale]
MDQNGGIKQREILDWALTTVEESENNLNSLVELCSESLDNLQSLVMAKLQNELELQTAAIEWEQWIQGINELRRQRKVFR